MSKAYLLDTNTITYILKKNTDVITKFQQVLKEGCIIILSPVAFYQIKRWLLKKNATRQLKDFEELASLLQFREINKAVWETAAELWSDLQRKGNSCPDDDIIIAAQAQSIGAIVVTNNTKHFELFEVTIDNWVSS
ncbi:MAG: PIN domain-containing protein [Planctomycetota bacterium]